VLLLLDVHSLLRNCGRVPCWVWKLAGGSDLSDYFVRVAAK
jgi:hypothetical protein